MGILGSKFQSPSQGLEDIAEGTSTNRKHGCECKKRKRNVPCDCESEQEEDDGLLDTPRRKKLKSTSRYIYQTLFLNGENSDIRICALGQEWNLHKVYLCQSGYFSSMFSGSWKESNMMEINLEIPDQNIDTEALQVVFGSLYRDDVLIKPSRVVSILAAACMLQLVSMMEKPSQSVNAVLLGISLTVGSYLQDGLIQQCGETMKENISTKTACGYYACASIYGLDSVMKKCLEWLLNNLMTHQNVELMKELSAEVMELLIQSSDLFVMQVEMDVYTALKKWMFLQLNTLWDGPIKQLLADADAWLCKRRTDLCEKEPFLDTEDGLPFRSVFKHVRLQYIINDLASARILERDNILPPDWLTSVYKSQWFAMLRTEFDNDNGPHEANKDEFERSSMRCGRKLTKDGDYCWRWTGFNFGFDLLVTYTNRFIVFKRNTLSQPCGGAVSLQPRRHLAYRLRLASFDSRGKLVCSRSTGYQLLTLEKDQEYVVMNLDSRLLSFPLYVCCNFLYTSPHSDQRPDSSEQESAALVS
ncbi:Germ cell-less protein-like 1 [Takifugu flavidus]|uniref:Germ cell-less protein-like 1 n=1 Tax=Takifugu flavidus TaxID=433684 RepID=A0A5C6NK39_9TELE|nr:Germ cell-less protein-like 1 [Takifugu flavidus]